MKKVITYGTFDLFHQGHYNILKRAKEYGDYLIVGVTGETYDISRGKLSVRDTLATRIENIQKTGLADEIIVEEYLGQKISDIIKYDIDTFVIGDDWKGKFDHLSRYCNMVYLERTKGISSTKIREENFKKYNIGVIIDIPDDNDIINQSKLVNGFEVDGVYATNEYILKAFQEKYSVEKSYTNLNELLDKSDIIYVRCSIEKREHYVRCALEQRKHVICDSPVTFQSEKLNDLFELAQRQKVILIENLKMVYIYVFNQLLWMTQGGLIGRILSFNCAISKNDQYRSNLFFDLSSLALVPRLTIMGLNYRHPESLVKKYNGSIEFASMNFLYEDARAVINVGNNIRVENKLEIIGEEGTIRMSGDWWRAKNFEVYRPDFAEPQVYNTNFDGNGFKYLIKAISTMLSNNRIESMGVFKDESLKISKILEEINKK